MPLGFSYDASLLSLINTLLMPQLLNPPPDHGAGIHYLPDRLPHPARKSHMDPEAAESSLNTNAWDIIVGSR